jgi:hypothetical protein
MNLLTEAFNVIYAECLLTTSEYELCATRPSMNGMFPKTHQARRFERHCPVPDGLSVPLIANSGVYDWTPDRNGSIVTPDK